MTLQTESQTKRASHQIAHATSTSPVRGRPAAAAAAAASRFAFTSPAAAIAASDGHDGARRPCGDSRRARLVFRELFPTVCTAVRSARSGDKITSTSFALDAAVYTSSRRNSGR